MKNESLFRLIAIIAALHVVVLSLAFGLRHLGYVLAATLSATMIWGVVFFLNEQQRRARIIGAIVTGLAVQQVTYQVWKAKLPGFWWPLAQFAALQFLIAHRTGRNKS
jgi:hypothetical protein